MSGRFRTLRSRLRDTRGFMLAEQLVSIIFIGLLCVVIAAGLTAALSAYSNITRQTNADNLLARTVEEVSNEFAYALTVEGTKDIEVQEPYSEIRFTSGSHREIMSLINSEAGRGIQSVTDSGKYANLVPPQHGLTATLQDVKYYRMASGGLPAGTWTFRVEVVNSGTNEIVAQTPGDSPMTVQRLGS